MKIYLIGYMSSGKSTLGKTLANRLQLKFIDIDEAFEAKYQISINDFFIKFGEEKFRELEHQLLSSLAKIEDAVISTGGGTPCYYNNIDIINENGISIYLKLHPKSIISRLKASKKQRPLVNDMDNETFEEYIENHLNTREIFYNKAQFIIKSENLTINELMQFVNDNIIKKE